MDRQQPLPVSKRKIDDRFDDLNAGIADQHIDPAIFRYRVGDALFDRRLVGDVHPDGKGIRSLRLDLARGGVGMVEIEIGNDRYSTLGGKPQRDLLILRCPVSPIRSQSSRAPLAASARRSRCGLPPRVEYRSLPISISTMPTPPRARSRRRDRMPLPSG